MTSLEQFKSPELRVLNQLLATATADASTAMCRWTNGLIQLSLDEVTEIPLEQVGAEFDFGYEMLTMIVLTLDGEVGGTMVLTFDEENGRRLAASLLRRPYQPSNEWSELDKSALNETGNILGCAYMNALTRLIDVELVPSPPYFIQDYGISVLEQALMAQASDSDNVLICRTRFHREGEELNWNVFFVPTQAMRNKLEDSLHIVT